MIGWQNVAALWALPLAAVPIVIHLLRTHHARRVTFPSLRFVPSSTTAAVRLWLPSDVILMLARMAIVTVAVLALAGPIVLTQARTTTWNARTARAVVVDVSDSMRAPDANGLVPEAAAGEAAAAELRTATYGRRIDVHDLEEGLARASRWLAASPPARREIVVISDLQRGALRGRGAAAVAEGIGLRFVPVGRPAHETTFAGARLFGAQDVAPRDQEIQATTDATAVAIQARTGSEMAGLRLIAAPGAERSVARLLRAVATAGAPDGSPQQPMVMQFAGGSRPSSPSAIAPIRPGWMLRTVLRLREASALSAPAPRSERDARAEHWTTLARKADGAPLVRVAASGSALLFDVAAHPDSLLAAEVVRAALSARLDANGYAEREIARLDERSLAALTRQPDAVTRHAWRTSDATDARWFWLLALVMLGAEQWLRAWSAHTRHQEARRAAA